MDRFKAHSEVPVPVWLQTYGSDGSWGNDAMPHAWIWAEEATFRGVEIWINYDDPNDREIGDKWLVLLVENAQHYHNQNGEMLYDGNDEALAIEGVNRGLEKLGSPLRGVSMTKQQRIAELNDLARTAMGVCSRVMQTPGINALPPADQSRIREKVELFKDFHPGNDPHGERDFGSFEHNGHAVLWKINYYDKALEFGSEDPSDMSQTTRVLTIMLREEY